MQILYEKQVKSSDRADVLIFFYNLSTVPPSGLEEHQNPKKLLKTC